MMKDKIMKRLMSAVIVIGIAGPCLAAEHMAAEQHVVDDKPHPAISEDTAWVGSVVRVIGGLFVAALGVGLVMRADTTEPPPQAHDDDHHGHDDGHGHAAQSSHGGHH